jgi:hypothetical protein
MFKKVLMVDQDEIEIWNFDREVDTEEVFVKMMLGNSVNTLLMKLKTKLKWM